jgi:hypothetical protein
MDRTSAQPQVNLNLLRRNSLKLQPQLAATIPVSCVEVVVSYNSGAAGEGGGGRFGSLIALLDK